MIETAMSLDRLEWHLDNWAGWMRAASSRLWYPPRCLVLGNSAHSDFDDMVEAADTRCAAAVDALVDDLPKLEHCAVHHVKLGCLWESPLEVRPVYEDASRLVGQGLTLRGIW